MIDFDESSKAWRANKKYKGNGYFVYMCNYIHSDSKRCRCDRIHNYDYCKRHLKTRRLQGHAKTLTEFHMLQ